ncbi:MAG: hypothetical protein ABH881_03825, partial [bacterium]
MSIFTEIKQANLIGRGGACFPVAEKWQMVKNSTGKKKYVICNFSEGEPGVEKDGFIFENYPSTVIRGIMEAIKYIQAEKGYIYINPEYHKKYQKIFKKEIKGDKIEIFKKPHEAGYIGGEETSLLNAMEGKRIEPRLRPPFPPISGFWRCPTLINNVETFYNVGLLAKNKYEYERFYTVGGDCLNAGVYEYPDDWTIKHVLIKSGNYPHFPFFIQV